MPLKLLYILAEGDFDKGMQRMVKPIADAATGAVNEAGQLALTGGRASIAAGGFGSKWQNAYRLTMFPPRTPSVDAAAYLFHKISYASIFETGGPISGKPNLWIPLRNAPVKIGRFAMTPANYEKNVGPLFPILRAGRPPLLAAKVALGAAGARHAVVNITTRTLRRGNPNGRLVTVPLFVGVGSIEIRKRFSVATAAARAAAQLPALYVKHLNPDS